MRCPDCHAEVDDEDERCPECGMYLLDSEWDPNEEKLSFTPKVFTAASILFGVVSLGFWVIVALEQLQRCFLPMFLFLPLIGYGLGRKELSVSKHWGLVGVILNMLAIAIFLVYVVYRAGSGESPFWL